MNKLIITLLATLALVQTGTAVTPLALRNTSPLNVREHPWLGQAEPSTRSPCPFLNTAANHDILPYDGKDIDVSAYDMLLQKIGLEPMVRKPFIDGLNKHVVYMRESVDPRHSNTTLSLWDLNIHGRIEHDLSMTRWNVPAKPYVGDNQRDPKLVEGLLAKAAERNSNVLGYDDVAMWRQERELQEEARYAEDPVTYREPAPATKQLFIGSGEPALLLTVFGRDGEISVDYAASFLGHEHFPEDWTPPSSVGLVELGAQIARCFGDYKLPTTVLKGSQWTKGLIAKGWSAAVSGFNNIMQGIEEGEPQLI